MAKSGSMPGPDDVQLMASVRDLADNPLAVDGVPVITFERMDFLHRRVRGTSGRNFRENRHRFVEGKHYHVRARKDLRELATKFVANSEGNPNIEVILLTERGYLLLTKSLTDDLAWRVQELLVDHYFSTAGPAAVTRPVLGRWGPRLTDCVMEARRRVRIERPGEWIVATESLDEAFIVEDELIAACFPLHDLDLPDGSIGRHYAAYRRDKAWACPASRDFLLRTPNPKCPQVHTNIYRDAEKRHFHRWLYDTYFPQHMPCYLKDKIRRDAAKWERLGVPTPRLPAVGVAADNASRRISSLPAVLPLGMRQPAIGHRQAGMFDPR